MKIKNEFVEAFSQQKIIPTKEPNKRYDRSLDVFSLEAKDFDKAIDLLKLFNKKAGVKEFELLRNEFISGSNCEDRIYSPNGFVKHLKDVLTKRMSDVERRIALKKVEEEWNFDKAYEIDDAYRQISQKYHQFINCKEEYDKEVKFLEDMLKIKLEFVDDVKSWIKEEVEENESSLDALSINDWNDILHILEYCNGRLKEIGNAHWSMRYR